jgi:hypothetical protein
MREQHACFQCPSCHLFRHACSGEVVELQGESAVMRLNDAKPQTTIHDRNRTRLAILGLILLVLVLVLLVLVLLVLLAATAIAVPAMFLRRAFLSSLVMSRRKAVEE